MRHTLITALLMAASAVGQTTSPYTDVPSASDPGNAPTAQMPVPQARVVESYNKLRRGRDEQIAILPAMLPAECFAQPRAARVDGVLADPTSLRLEYLQGFKVTFGDGKKFRRNSEPSNTFTQGGDVILLKLKAARDLPPGDYKLQGKIRFSPALKESCPQQQDVVIPVTVVDHNDAVAKSPWPYQPFPDHAFAEGLGNVAWAIVIIPLIPFLLIAGAIMCGSPLCTD